MGVWDIFEPKAKFKTIKCKKIEFCVLNFVLGLNMSYNHLPKILEKLRKLRKSSHSKQNIHIIYNETLHYNCLQVITTL